MMEREKIAKDLLAWANIDGGSVFQEPYKAMVFELFTKAYDEGFFENGEPGATTDELMAVALAQRASMDDDEAAAFRDRTERLLELWRQWAYAWDRHGELQLRQPLPRRAFDLPRDVWRRISKN